MEQKEFVALVEDAIEKFQAQGRPSRLPAGLCKYTSPMGCCIVGHMMPTDQIRKAADSLKATSVDDLVDVGFNWIMQFDADQQNLMQTLQGIHDSIPVSYSASDIEDAVYSMKAEVASYKVSYQLEDD